MPQERILEITRHLIGMRTTADRLDELEKCAEFIKAQCVQKGLKVESYSVDGKETIIVSKNGGLNHKVLLYAHYDVVDADDFQFTTRIEGDKLFGRGAMDMKGSLAVFMVLIEELIDLDLDVACIFTPDEEIGGFDGLGAMLGKGLSCDVMLMPDGGEKIENLVIKEKGLVQIELEALGVSAHGSRPWRGTNAIERLMQACFEIQEFFNTRFKCEPPDYWVPTFNMGVVQGGKAWNSVACTATMSGEVRLTSELTVEGLFDAINSLLPEGVFLKFKPTHIKSRGLNIDLDHPLFQPYLEAVRSIDREPVFTQTHGRSDAAHLAETGILCIQGQPDGAGLHGANEHVHIPSLLDYYNVVKAYTQKVAVKN